MKEKLSRLLIKLSGKKSTIAVILGLANGYAYAKGLYGSAEFELISGILVVLFGVTSYTTKKAYEYIGSLDANL